MSVPDQAYRTRRNIRGPAVLDLRTGHRSAHAHCAGTSRDSRVLVPQYRFAVVLLVDMLVPGRRGALPSSAACPPRPAPPARQTSRPPVSAVHTAAIRTARSGLESWLQARGPAWMPCDSTRDRNQQMA
eukprot:829938-Rhodomonas_salina.1